MSERTATAVRHDRHRHGIPEGDEALLALPEAQATIARIAASVDPDYGDRAAHIKRVATLAIRARLRPTNKFAEPTLFIAQATTTGPDAGSGQLSASGPARRKGTWLPRQCAG